MIFVEQEVSAQSEDFSVGPFGVPGEVKGLI